MPASFMTPLALVLLFRLGSLLCSDHVTLFPFSVGQKALRCIIYVNFHFLSHERSIQGSAGTRDENVPSHRNDDLMLRDVAALITAAAAHPSYTDVQSKMFPFSFLPALRF